MFPMPIDIVKPFLDLVDKTATPTRPAAETPNSVPGLHA